MADLLKIIWDIVQLIIGFNLIFPVMLYILYSLTKKGLPSASINNAENDYAVIITAYKDAEPAKAAVASVLASNYSNFLIYLVADQCDISGLEFSDERVTVLRPAQALNSNTGSHFHAINSFKRPHPYLTIIDSDNLVHRDYFTRLDVYFNSGFEAVQGVREAKNLDSTFACLDAARDIYYHFYDGQLLFGAGSSATLAGSGMAFTTKLYRDCLGQLNITGAGFDKVLQAAILGQNRRIAFNGNAVVYDEKTSRSAQLVNQRSRWINTWFRYFKFGFSILGSGLKNFSRNQFLFGLVLLRPPLFIFLLLAAVCMLINLWVSGAMVLIWLLAFGVFIAGFILALKKTETDPRIYRSLKNIPVFMFYQLVSLLNARRANQRSVATEHYHATNINELGNK